QVFAQGVSPATTESASPASESSAVDAAGSNPSFSPGDLPARFKSTQPRSSGVAADLFSPLPREFKQLGSSQNWLVAGIGGISTVVAHSLDTKVAGATWPNGALPVMQPGEIVGSFAAQTGGALAAYAAGRLRGSPTVTRV